MGQKDKEETERTRVRAETGAEMGRGNEKSGI